MPDARAQSATETDGSSEQGRARSGRRRGRRRGVEIRPGSVKQARQEAGLSLGQVAQADISRTAIYFVETGKAKPSMETLQLIATRTNKPLDFFLGEAAGGNEDAALAEIERLVAVGDNAGAVAAGEALIARTSDARIGAHARLHLAAAYVRLDQPVRARGLATAARVSFERAADVLMTAEALSWEAAAALMVQDRAALGLAEEALARCRSLKPVPSMTEARLLSILGTVHNSRHEYAKAIEAYEQAVEVGAAVPDLRGLSYVYGNLSLAYLESGKYEQAARYAHRAMALYETLHDQVSIAWAENNLALLVNKQGDVAGALRHAETSLRMLEELGVEAGKAHVFMTLCELELARANYPPAARQAAAALEAAQRAGETANVGEARVWLGRVAAARGDEAAADVEFAVAFQVFESVDAAEWQARGHVVYADILEARGDLVGANRQLRHALAALGTQSTAVDNQRIAIA